MPLITTSLTRSSLARPLLNRATYRAAASAMILTLAAQATPAFAGCSHAANSHGSATVTQSCERGVTVHRVQQPRLPHISAAQSNALAVQRQRAAQRAQDQRSAIALRQEELKLQRLQLSQQDYLYRDANSPLRRGPSHRYNNGGAGFLLAGGGIGFYHRSRNGLIILPAGHR